MESKIKFLEQQKETCQTKYDKSIGIEFIKEVKKDLEQTMEFFNSFTPKRNKKVKKNKL